MDCLFISVERTQLSAFFFFSRTSFSSPRQSMQPSYIEACLKAGRLVEFAPQFMLVANQATLERMQEESDDLGQC